MSVNKIMCERIKKLRGNRLQDECAKSLGVSRGALSFYETGDRTPNANVIYKMSELFNVTSDYILGLSNVKSYNADIKTVSKYTGLSDISIANINDLTADDKEKLNRLFENKKFVKFLILLSELEEK